MEITKEYIFKCFRNELSEKEKADLDAWIAEDEANAGMYKEALVEYEYLLINGDVDALKEMAPVSHSGKTGIVRTIVKAAIGVAAAVAIFFTATWLSDYRMQKDLSRNLITATALPGQIVSMGLPDGTSVQLNSGATMYYPAMFKGKEREVRLEGEAFFEVAHDSKKPFIVKTFASDIKVLGTKFNVNADRNAGEFSVTLAEGSVQVSSLADPGRIIVMKPDEKVYMADGKLMVKRTKVKDEIRWKDGIIDIDGLDFDELIDKLEMAFGVDIVIDRETLPEFKYTGGRLRVSDGIEYALKVLQHGADFAWTKDFRTGTIYIR
ncbi:MAG TPA: FecR domain-containing protein [Candidatus Cryptobacteroides intestinipullorum]|nr:FecR domain-containing protein [Candidatus Cryptobacteroides intestinipullorum]